MGWVWYGKLAFSSYIEKDRFMVLRAGLSWGFWSPFRTRVAGLPLLRLQREASILNRAIVGRQWPFYRSPIGPERVADTKLRLNLSSLRRRAFTVRKNEMQEKGDLGGCLVFWHFPSAARRRRWWRGFRGGNHVVDPQNHT